MDNNTADALILRISQGDMSALEELYNGLSRGVYAFALSIVRDKTMAEDIMQDTFVRVFSAASAFHAKGTGISWVMRIAHNLAINSVKTRSCVPENESEKNAPTADTEGAAVERVMIKNALDRLDDAEREIVALHSVVGLTLAEISQIVGQPLGTVKWRHATALKKLRKMLETEVDE